MRGVQLSLPFARRAVLAGAGARATEQALVEALAGLAAESRRDPRRLALPVRVVVPSRSLRLHLGATLPRRLGGALLGVRIQTLHGLAAELVGAAHPDLRPGGALQDVFAMRLGAQHDALRGLVEGYADGHQGVAEAVRQLLDAGLVAALAGPACECVDAAEGLAPAERERAAAALQVAAGTERVLDELGLFTPASLMRRAAELLGKPGPDRLPSRALFLHGFTDATAVAADLLAELVRLPGAVLTVDLPPDPAIPEVADAGVRLGHRLRDRLGGDAPTAPHRVPAPTLEVYTADGEGELAELARRVAALLDAGVRPEAIGVVSPNLRADAGALRRWFDRYAIPYSGLDATAPDAPDARWRALPQLVRDGARAGLDRWLELVGTLGGEPLDPTRRARVRLALRATGCSRVGHAADLDPDALLDGGDALVLPGALGLVGDRVERPTLDAGSLRAVVAAARAHVAWVEALPARTTRAAWEARLAELGGLLGRENLSQRWAGLAEVPDLELHLEELLCMLTAELEDAGRQPLGGRGGGVQVLAVREARGRTFDRLFLLGNVRGGGGRRDALLSEDVRRALRAVLPDLPMARDRFDEERLHFAWLVSAAPHVTLSWPTTDARGKARSISPLVERLRWAGLWTTAVVAPPPCSAPLPMRASAADHAVVAGLADATFLPRPLGAALAAAGVAEPREVASALMATLAEVDTGSPTASPYLGAVGMPVGEDPRARPLYVSVAENYVRCPWKTLLERYLGVEALPDPLDSVPEADDRVVGNLVHAVLERVVRRGLHAPARTVAWARDAPAVSLAWPAVAELDRIVLAAAEKMLADEGLRLPGLAILLARRVQPLLEVAHGVDWNPVPPRVLGAETEGSVRVDGHEVRFRADRTDRRDVEMLLTDYKSGTPLVHQKSPEKRRAALVAAIRRGEALQIAAYAASDATAVGRLLYVGAGLPPEQRVLTLGHDDHEARETLEGTLRVALAGLRAGVFFPRVTAPDDDKESRSCGGCAVREACVRGDSTARLRLRERARALAATKDQTGLEGYAQADHGVWWLPAERKA